MKTGLEVPHEVKECGFQLPRGYYRIQDLQLTNLDPWYLVKGEEFEKLYEGMHSRYPARLTLPFARRIDCDDVACFVIRDDKYPQGHILILHDYASPGYEVDAELATFWDWFRLAVEDMIEISSHMV